MRKATRRMFMDIWTQLNALLATIGFYEAKGYGWERDYNNSVKRLFRKFSHGIGYCLKIVASGQGLQVSLSRVGSVSLIPIGHELLTVGRLQYWLEWMLSEFTDGRLAALIVEEDYREAQRVKAQAEREVSESRLRVLQESRAASLTLAAANQAFLDNMGIAYGVTTYPVTITQDTTTFATVPLTTVKPKHIKSVFTARVKGGLLRMVPPISALPPIFTGSRVKILLPITPGFKTGCSGIR